MKGENAFHFFIAYRFKSQAGIYGSLRKYSEYSGPSSLIKSGNLKISSDLWYIDTSKSGIQFLISSRLPIRASYSSPSTSYLIKSTLFSTESVLLHQFR